MPTYRNALSGVVMTVPEGRQLGPDWERVDKTEPKKKTAAKRASSKKSE